MNSILRQSLPVQAWVSICTIALLCFMSALGGGVLAWVSEADAQAINTAGSIRMATYRINFQIATDFTADSPSNLSIAVEQDRLNETLEKEVLALSESAGTGIPNQSRSAKVDALVTDMENRLTNLREYQMAYANKHRIINDQLQRIESQWFNTLKPIVLSQNKEAFYDASPPYIRNVDNFVNELQIRNEQRQIWQQFLQVLSLILTIIIMLIGMYKLRQNVLVPVQRLIKANSLFKQGKHDTRVSISGYTEFKKLGDSFNNMASTIETHQRSLKSEMQIKTKHLTTANEVLSLFYDFSKQLTTSSVTLYKLDQLITDFGHIFPHLDFTLCIQNDILNGKEAIALHDDKMKELCSKLSCDNCFIKNNVYAETYPITHQNLEFGELKVRPKSILLMNSELATELDAKDKKEDKTSKRIQTVDLDSTYLNAENSELITALTNLIGTALSLRKQRQQEHQIILLEERSTIARELHDSLAQSLSYLKIQVSVLEKRLENASEAANDDHVLQSINQIKLGLSSAYQQLRDLLVTFRLTIDSDNFDEALREVADEFATRGHFDIQINNSIMSLNLSATEQVHLVQIIREALSNISRHAMAKNVTIDLGYDDESNYIVMKVLDDGVGIVGEVDQTQHHGLMIMKERAHNLGGILKVSSNQPSGTIITVKFAPNFFNEYLIEKTRSNTTDELS